MSLNKEKAKFYFRIAREVMCWAGLIFLAWNPEGAFTGFIEDVGRRYPMLILASGAGFDHVKDRFSSLGSDS